MFAIQNLEWERIFLNIKIQDLATSEEEQKKKVDFFLKHSRGKTIPLTYTQEAGQYCFCINMACVSDRSFLDNGRWQIFARCQTQDGSVETICKIQPSLAYRLDDLSRIFRYAENQMAYNLSFGVTSQDEQTLDFYLDSYFLMENKHWRRRRYVKEVRGLKDKGKRVLMFGAILLIRGYYHLLYGLIPKRGKRILLMSETKDVLWGNLKYIDDRLRQRGLDKEFRLSYSYRKAAGTHQGVRDIFSWIKVVTKMAAQDVIFIDDYAPVLGFFHLGKKTKLIQVWHAGEGFKSVGYSRFGKEGSPFPQGSCHKKYTHVITGSQHLVKVFQEVFAIEEEAFYPVGMPRLDGFLDEEKIRNFREGFFRKHPYLQEKKIILFAPTYRGAEQKLAYYDYEKLDLKRIYDFCKKENYAFLVKMHPFVAKKMEIPEEYRDAIYEFSDFPNINDLYYVTDLLITDYSSNYFEYALMERPVVFYTYDRQVYELTRGVHRSIKECAPGKVCDTFEELMECLWKGDFQEEKIKAFVAENFGDYSGHATDQVIDRILLGKETDYE